MLLHIDIWGNITEMEEICRPSSHSELSALSARKFWEMDIELIMIYPNNNRVRQRARSLPQSCQINLMLELGFQHRTP